MRKSFAKLRAHLDSISRADAGLSLPEVLIAVGLSGLLALGCTQLALASFTSANYTQGVAVRSLSTGNLNRIVTADMANASGFLVSSGIPAHRGATECSTVNMPDAGTVSPLFSVFNADGSSAGYELRTIGNVGALWRVSCPTAGNPIGNAQILATDLPTGATYWQAAVMCAKFPAGGALTTFACVQDTNLNSLSSNPGIIFTVPATLTIAPVQKAAQTIIAARNIG